ncbi:hypothetical protein G7Y79_00007g022010 [Physcia stellaris]|nr:hypothetical protein G7Y79_00007g022010 [Physcia stellaris]
MVLLKDFEVRVALKPTDGVAPGEAFKEYPNPKPSASSHEWLAERYIEAKPNQEFQVEVYLKPSFKLFAANTLKVSLRIDNDTVSFNKYYNEEWIAANISKGKPFILHNVLNTDGKQHSMVSFSFGSLSVDETIDIDKENAVEQAEKMGRIVVVVSRVRAKKLKRPKVKSLNFYKPLASLAYAKDIVKDQHIRQAMVPGSHTPAPAPRLTIDYEYSPYTARGCQPARFVFRYRDDLGLKQLGCIPKDEGGSPKEVSSLETRGSHGSEERVVAGLDSSKEDEIATLRKQVEQLRSRDDENQDFKRKFDQMAQGFAVMKQMNEQLATMFGNFSNAASSSSVITNSATMTGDTSGSPDLPSVVSGIKPEQSLKGIKQEEGAVRADGSAYFSYDDQHQFHLDERSLRYYYPPTLGADLSKGFNTFQQLDDTADDHLDGLLKTIIDLEQRTGTRCTADFITWRGMMTKIMAIPYDNMNGMEQHGQPSKFGGPSQDMMSYWGIPPGQPKSHESLLTSIAGYKFETLSLIPDTWAATPREVIENRENEIVNNYAQYCSIVKTGIGKSKLIIGGEVDAVWDSKPANPAQPINWVELKTSATPQSDRDMQKYERKLLKFWIQSFLLGVPKIIVGFRSKDGILERLEELETGAIPGMVKNKGKGSWDGNVCVGFAAGFWNVSSAFFFWWALNIRLKATITEGGVWRIRRRERSPVVEVFKHEESGYGDILCPAFVEWRTKGLEGAQPAVGAD